MAILVGFLDLTRLLGRVMGSDLVVSVDNTCAGLYQVFCVSNTDMISREALKKVRKSNGFYSERAIWRVFWTYLDF